MREPAQVREKGRGGRKGEKKCVEEKGSKERGGVGGGVDGVARIKRRGRVERVGKRGKGGKRGDGLDRCDKEKET